MLEDKNNNNNKFSKIKIIPTIDISKGKAVLVNKGNVVIDNGDPFERANELSINNDFQIADIDAAKGLGSNKEIIKKISNKYSCYVGGGIRTKEIAYEYLNQNIKRVVISSSIFNNKELLKEIPKNRMIIALDIDDNFEILIKGRTEKLNKNLFDVIKENLEFISMLTITFHNTEGTGEGIDLKKVHKIKIFLDDLTKEKNIENIRLVVAGGIKNINEIKDLISMNVSPQFGYALWKGLFTLGDIYSNIIDYKKLSLIQNKELTNNNLTILIPTLIMRNDGLLLNLIYSNNESIKKSVDERILYYHSIDNLMKNQKEECSKGLQKIIKIGFNYERTFLLFIIEDSNDEESIINFTENKADGLLFLEKLLKKDLNKNIDNEKYLISNLFENLNDLQYINNNNNNDNKINFEKNIEILANIFYNIVSYSVNKNISINEIYNELKRRHYQLNKPNYEINSIPEGIKIGFYFQNEIIENKIFNYLKLNGLFIEKEFPNEKRSLKYKGYFLKNKEIKLIIFKIKQKDIIKFYEYKYLDCIICYDDAIIDNINLFEKVDFPYKKNVNELQKNNIYVICNKDFDLNNYINKKDKIIIFSEYLNLAKNWSEKNKLNSDITFISGESEQFLINEMCDIVICLNNEENIIKNELKYIDILYESNLGIFTNKNFINIFKNNLFCNE